jgi:hypothetical protein
MAFIPVNLVLIILKKIRKAIFLRECFVCKNPILLLSKLPMLSSQAKRES